MLTSNFDKFKLLLWKNWLLQWSHKLQFCIELLLPVLFSLLLVMVRTLVEPESVGFVIYNTSMSIDNLDLLRYHMMFNQYPLRFHLVYSPSKSPIFQAIVKDAAAILGVTYGAVKDSKTLEELLIQNSYNLAGIEFEDSMASITTYPQHLNYKIRFPCEMRSDISPFLVTWWTNRAFWPLDRVGPRNKDFPSGGLPGGYMDEGFLPVQYAITTAFIQQSSNQAALPKLVLQRYPYPPYIDDPLITGLPGIMGMVILLSFIYPCTCTVKYITAEKEKQLKEVMKIMGLQNWIHWMAWFVQAFLMMGFSAFLIAIVLTVKWKNNVAVLTYSSFTPLLFFLLIYTTTSITLCFMLATFFSKASTASAATGLIWLLMYLPNTMFEMNYDNVSSGAKIACSLISNTAMGLGLRLIARDESEGEGLQWRTMFVSTNVDDDLSLGHIIAMMLISCVIHMTICLYMEQIFPGEFGVPKKWNFPFKKEFWVGKREYINIAEMSETVERENPKAFENDPVGAVVGIQVKNLTKRFGGKAAVNNLSMNMYENEITVLLGHNGAGKTTTISMLTGMFSPTSGTATINGCDIRTNIDGARSSLGICPQHNILFDELTVRQHLIFYARLKGLKGDRLESEVRKYIRKIELKKKANLQSSKLSGGMQRKLSVCCAFCGGTKVVLCDEPSSGMDPAARRKLWNLLQSQKKGRTVLLTTHFMDEADVLGDRIAIMSAGDLKCAGTSFFLKKQFGSGYHLICVKKENCDSKQVTSLLAKYIPNIEPESEIGAELAYLLPEAYSSKFKNMFEDLETNSGNLNLNGYGVSITSLEEVFMKTGAETQAVGRGPVQHPPMHNGSEGSEQRNENGFLEKDHLLQGTKLITSQWRSMFLKKYLNTIRHKIMFAIQNLMPILFITLTFIFGTVYYENLPPLMLDLYQFPSTVTVLDTSPTLPAGSMVANIADNYKKIVRSFGPDHELELTGKKPFINYMLEFGKKYQSRINSKYIAAATMTEGTIIAWLNNKPLHSAPVTVNLIQNAIAKTVIGPKANISVTNYPLPYAKRSEFAKLGSGQTLGTQVATNLSFCMSFISGLYVMFVIKERQSRAKLLQFVCGARILIFWLTHLLWDIVTLAITAVVIIITFVCFQEKGYTTFGELARIFSLIIMFNIAVLPFTYLIGSFLLDPSTGYARLAIFNLFCGNAMFIVVLIMRIPLFNTKEESEFLEDIFLFIPHFALAEGLDQFYVNDGTRALCDSVKEGFTGDLCLYYPTCCNIQPYYGWKTPGVLRQITCLIITGTVTFTILLLREYHFVHKFWRRIKDKIERPPSLRRFSLDEYYDEDVENEKDKVARMSKKERAEENLVLDHVTKQYDNFIAVNQICVAVRHSECFGLLGVNGAGKTTTFKMLTGDEEITSGAAYVKGWNIRKNMNKVYQEIGYCPQFDALFDQFTGRETLKIYSLLRGIPENMISDISLELAKGFGFIKHYNKQVHAYSGGNKRKLSAAVAVLGGPSVIYLDEPTTGMDPAARRQLWNMVCRIRDSGKSIILTSHSMEECEALCTRLAIMVNGEFKCIGSTQHLKNKFSKGLILKIKLKKYGNVSSSSKTTDESSEPKKLMQRDIDAIMKFITGEFRGSYLQEQFQGILTFYIPLTFNLWSKMFGDMEKYKTALNIEDYSISQTTLEEIFLQFATYQKQDPREISKRKKPFSVS